MRYLIGGLSVLILLVIVVFSSQPGVHLRYLPNSEAEAEYWYWLNHEVFKVDPTDCHVLSPLRRSQSQLIIRYVRENAGRLFRTEIDTIPLSSETHSLEEMGKQRFDQWLNDYRMAGVLWRDSSGAIYEQNQYSLPDFVYLRFLQILQPVMPKSRVHEGDSWSVVYQKHLSGDTLLCESSIYRLHALNEVNGERQAVIHFNNTWTWQKQQDSTWIPIGSDSLRLVQVQIQSDGEATFDCNHGIPMHQTITLQIRQDYQTGTGNRRVVFSREKITVEYCATEVG